jgi:hypothetical protein
MTTATEALSPRVFAPAPSRKATQERVPASTSRNAPAAPASRLVKGGGATQTPFGVFCMGDHEWNRLGGV